MNFYVVIENGDPYPFLYRTYNEAVDAYNLKRDRLKADINNWNAQNSSFNAQIDTYNNYLDANCTKQ